MPDARAKAMSDYYDAEKNRDVSAQYVVQALLGSKTKVASGAYDAVDWWKNTINSFARYKRSAPQKDGKNTALGSRERVWPLKPNSRLIDQDWLRNSITTRASIVQR